ncbi:MAG: hypothetical protein GQ582_00125 [Methyloprofundus sp.]|nr:hypothetical protein [Methyloprofundus sp.]
MKLLDSTARTCSEKTDFMYLLDTPVVYHCHHFNLFLEQTIDDALGWEEGQKVRFNAAREAARQLLSGVIKAAEAETPAERLQVATTLFKKMGHGTLQILSDYEGGEAFGEYLHYGYSWLQKYGHTVKQLHPNDLFAAGYIAAAVEVVYGLEPDAMLVTETECSSMKAPRCAFTVTKQISDEPFKALPTISKELCESAEITFETGLHEDKIIAIANGLRDFTAQVEGDERGLVEAFGVFVTMHLPSYYNRISYDTEAWIQENRPQVRFALTELLKESGHVCVFNTFGGILSSMEWEGMLGKPSTDPHELLASFIAIGRALGFGKWTIKDFIPGEKLVLRTPTSYESAYFTVRHGESDVPNNYFVQGAAQAIMTLIDDLDWSQEIDFSQDLYLSLFKKGAKWDTQETSSLSTGAAYTEVVVQRN